MSQVIANQPVKYEQSEYCLVQLELTADPSNAFLVATLSNEFNESLLIPS